MRSVFLHSVLTNWPSKHLAFVALALLAWKPLIVSAENPPVPPSGLDQRLAALDQAFHEAAEREVEKPSKEALETLNKGYAGAVERSLNAAMQAGKTDEALALRDEKRRIDKGDDTPADDDTTPETLKALRKTYRSARAERELERTRKLQPLFDRYEQALTALAAELTKAGRFDDALRVKGVSADIAKARATGNAGLAVTAGAGKTKLSGLVRSFTNTLGMKFVPVPRTSVLFCIHETRRRDYAAYAAANAGVNEGWKTPKREDVPVGSGSEDDPVVMVSWDDAVAFCAWLSKLEGHNYRLPTDREWSIAVGLADREAPTASPKSLSGRIKAEYPWGNKWPPPKGSGNFQDTLMQQKFPTAKFSVGYNDGYATTAPVMSFKSNSLGIYDLAGNAWEWCEDWSDETQQDHVLRGGSWATVNLLSSERYVTGASRRMWDTGFRCVVEPDR